MVTLTEFVLSGLLGVVTAIALICYAEWQTLKEKADG